MSNSVLFYSNKCQHSKKALDIINKNNINIKLVSIDDKNVKLPSFLKVVPTIIQQGNDRPLEGDFVFKWLERSKSQNTNTISSQPAPIPLMIFSFSAFP